METPETQKEKKVKKNKKRVAMKTTAKPKKSRKIMKYVGIGAAIAITTGILGYLYMKNDGSMPNSNGI